MSLGGGVSCSPRGISFKNSSGHLFKKIPVFSQNTPGCQKTGFFGVEKQKNLKHLSEKWPCHIFEHRNEVLTVFKTFAFHKKVGDQNGSVSSLFLFWTEYTNLLDVEDYFLKI